MFGRYSCIPRTPDLTNQNLSMMTVQLVLNVLKGNPHPADIRKWRRKWENTHGWMIHGVLLRCGCVVIVNSLQVPFFKTVWEKRFYGDQFPNIPCKLGHDVSLNCLIGLVHHSLNISIYKVTYEAPVKTLILFPKCKHSTPSWRRVVSAISQISTYLGGSAVVDSHS